MALRVLLADESSTIKKAIQMVLSDYGVEVKTVPTGIDVLSVTQSFGPDIIIADILLNKKNGYEVCAELKKNPNTKKVPIILMWSSFMQLNEQLFLDCKADASLEKPFDTLTIRSLVEKLVPKLQSFPLKGFLNHPPMPDFEESDTFVRQKNSFNTLTESPPIAADLPKVETQTLHSQIFEEPQQPPQSDLQNDQWSTAQANQFVIETESFGEFEEVKAISSLGNTTNEEAPDLQRKINEQVQTYLKDSPVTTHRATSTRQPKNTFSSFDEQLAKDEIRQIAERICWQIIPEITEKIVRDELNKLLEGIEKSI